MKTSNAFVTSPIVVTEKMDGSNVCLLSNGLFSRSHSGYPTHPSFDLLKAWHAEFRHNISDDLEIYGEWLYARHSIAYSELPAYLMVFAIRNIETGIWHSWENVERTAKDLGLETVPVLFRGFVPRESALKALINIHMRHVSPYGDREGVVVRTEGPTTDQSFADNIAKYVRRDHVQTDEHWKDRPIVKNGLAKI